MLVQGRQLGRLCRQVISFLIVVDEIHSSKYAKIFDNENLSILMTATYPDGWRYHGMLSRVTFKGYKSPAKSVGRVACSQPAVLAVSLAGET